jgi:hypothetical protein
MRPELPFEKGVAAEAASRPVIFRDNDSASINGYSNI